jgi:5-methylcytosine-specific restriction protein A
MSWGFEIGRVYSRRVDIHARFGGQQQGGIITSAKHSLVIIVTGEEGLQHGYADRYRADGVFEYYGEGQVGDMQLHKGNRAIAQHSADGKSLLLFRQTRAGLRFECEMICEVHHVQRAPDRTGTERDALVFELRALDAVAEIVDAEPATPDASMKELQQRAFAAAGASPQSPSHGKRNVYQRSRDVRVYVLARAAGKCEACAAPEPFLRADGTPYLEPHHLRRLSDGGPDHPAHVIALCPNCHRRVHVGADGAAYNVVLSESMANIEPKV